MNVPNEFAEFFQGIDLTKREIGFLIWLTEWDQNTIRNMRTVLEKVRAAGVADGASSQPSNEPLTMEELRKMDGEPVYMTFPSDTGNQCGHWALVGTQRWGAVSLIYGCGWSSYESAIETLGAKFYRRPPEGEEEKT
ncbi:hypothetical protein [uncultured Oscillibacter sp.]|uniref:hypothetical protein n=1 Tax=uncultured Oscillibacter sp. TaxID=876091 RepID=UPI0026659123|nr:hypothetical protein [uncultured Oscillibacter sp.]